LPSQSRFTSNESRCQIPEADPADVACVPFRVAVQGSSIEYRAAASTGRVDHPRGIVDRTLLVKLDAEPVQNAVEQSSFLPLAELVITGLLRSISQIATDLRQVAPSRPRTENPEDPVQDGSFAAARAPFRLVGKQVFDQPLLRIGQFVAAHDTVSVWG